MIYTRPIQIIRLGFGVILMALGVHSDAAQAKRAVTFQDLMKIQRISDPQVSPNGHWIEFVQTTVKLETNKKSSHIWLAPIQGGEARQLTQGEGADSRPRWSPDSLSLAFVSSRSGKSQIWIIPADGGEAHQVTSISTQADGVLWSKKGDWLLFTSKAYSDCSDEECNQKRLEETSKSMVKAQIIDGLLFRHWDEYREGRYTHLFIVPTKGGKALDLTLGKFDSPTFFLGAPDGYSISPDGTEVCYTSNRSARAAWTTNNDLYRVSDSGGEAKNITNDNTGSDAAPQYSPDGRYIAYTSQPRNGYESDIFRLRIYDRQTEKVQDLTPGFDQWVNSFVWGADSDTIYFTAPERGQQPVFKTSVSRTRVEKVLGGFNDSPQVTPDGRWLVMTRESTSAARDRARGASGLHSTIGARIPLTSRHRPRVTSKTAIGAK